ncbi:unnamed protein product [Vitrella brassicaformis CCMP3155]|uniref:Uncharacterized protein n=2 Tax=Vitrella brassicaformis TaxID=1169539 RepID=A0A0G4F0Y6_VITBC|nr:unnamed protein product [Vitrella brassicaformis CCMP3155]|eukprot:CEM05286.1 unnamed protein product [Vitrella brassicaformis CCMP3155]
MADPEVPPTPQPRSEAGRSSRRSSSRQSPPSRESKESDNPIYVGVFADKKEIDKARQRRKSQKPPIEDEREAEGEQPPETAAAPKAAAAAKRRLPSRAKEDEEEAPPLLSAAIIFEDKPLDELTGVPPPEAPPLRPSLLRPELPSEWQRSSADLSERPSRLPEPLPRGIAGRPSPASQERDVSVQPLEVTVKARRASKSYCASRIQRAWRSMSDRRIFEALKQLISFHQRGDPMLMLRAFNPQEAQLLDPAMQAHVRFRLGGAWPTFPPLLYYKIFVHGPVVDVNAFAPRPYQLTEEQKSSSIRKRAALLHRLSLEMWDGPLVDGKSRLMLEELEGEHSEERLRDCWYIREENNGWRTVAVRVDRVGPPDEIERLTALKSKRPNYHYSRLKRRQDVEAAKRQRRLDWLRSLYRVASEAPAEEEGLEELADMTMEDDALIEWAATLPTDLNFDHYMVEWTTIATSGLSEAGKPLLHRSITPLPSSRRAHEARERRKRRSQVSLSPEGSPRAARWRSVSPKRSGSLLRSRSASMTDLAAAVGGQAGEVGGYQMVVEDTSGLLGVAGTRFLPRPEAA